MATKYCTLGTRFVESLFLAKKPYTFHPAEHVLPGCSAFSVHPPLYTLHAEHWETLRLAVLLRTFKWVHVAMGILQQDDSRGFSRLYGRNSCKGLRQ